MEGIKHYSTEIYEDYIKELAELKDGGFEILDKTTDQRTAITRHFIGVGMNPIESSETITIYRIAYR